MSPNLSIKMVVRRSWSCSNWYLRYPVWHGVAGHYWPHMSAHLPNWDVKAPTQQNTSSDALLNFMCLCLWREHRMKGITEMQDMICYDLKGMQSQQCYFKIFAPCRHFQIRTQAQLSFSGPIFLKQQSSSQTLKRVFGLSCCSPCDRRDQTVAPQTWKAVSALAPLPCTYGRASSPSFILHIHPCKCLQQR